MTMTHKNNFYTNIVVFLKFIFSVVVFLSYTSYLYANIADPINPIPEHSIQGVKIIKALERYHYLEKNLDNTMSAEILNRYIKRLDPGKQLFTNDNIDHFLKYQFRLDDDLKQGNLTIAYKLFNLYIQRAKERLEYISLLIKTWEKDFNFNKDESMIIENDLRQWQPDKKALYSLWKKDLKNVKNQFLAQYSSLRKCLSG
jgi:carboxyl-terminal processing protease